MRTKPVSPMPEGLKNRLQSFCSPRPPGQSCRCIAFFIGIFKLRAHQGFWRILGAPVWKGNLQAPSFLGNKTVILSFISWLTRKTKSIAYQTVGVHREMPTNVFSFSKKLFTSFLIGISRLFYVFNFWRCARLRTNLIDFVSTSFWRTPFNIDFKKLLCSDSSFGDVNISKGLSGLPSCLFIFFYKEW